jgi:hypothetical protein
MKGIISRIFGKSSQIRFIGVLKMHTNMSAKFRIELEVDVLVLLDY